MRSSTIVNNTCVGSVDSIASFLPPVGNTVRILRQVVLRTEPSRSATYQLLTSSVAAPNRDSSTQILKEPDFPSLHELAVPVLRVSPLEYVEMFRFAYVPPLLPTSEGR